MRKLQAVLVLVGAALFAAPSAMGQNAVPAGQLAAGQSLTAELTPNDVQRRSGKYEDVYTLQGRRGQRIQIDLAAEDFDAYLVVTGPEGFSFSNDDGVGGDSTDSRLVLELPADGAYRVAATSFRPGETGRYRIAAAVPAAGVAAARPLAAAPITIGQSVNGALAQGDGRGAAGEYTDHYRFTARRGQRVAISLEAGKLDPVLVLARPDGTSDRNDDTEIDGQPSTNSRIDTVLAEDGDYVITVTSYGAAETGDYRLALAPSAGHPRQLGVPGGPRVIALLVGVSDYGGRTSNLANTDADARELYQGLSNAGLLHPASQMLTNEEATTKRVEEAFARAAAAAGPNDTFMFFFSGHGDQIDVPVGSAELDGRAETIELYDEAMTDAQLAPLFASVRSRLSLLVVDACYAGGFRSLVNRPNVMGLFSSEEDLTSLVASRFKAGGFLSYFLRAGLAGEADEDGDRIVSAGEISTYVRRRFRREGDIPATTREDDRHFQNLLIERGGVHVDDVIVRFGGGTTRTAASLERPVRVQPAAAVTLPEKRAPRPKR